MLSNNTIEENIEENKFGLKSFSDLLHVIDTFPTDEAAIIVQDSFKNIRYCKQLLDDKDFNLDTLKLVLKIIPLSENIAYYNTFSYLLELNHCLNTNDVKFLTRSRKTLSEGFNKYYAQCILGLTKPTQELISLSQYDLEAAIISKMLITEKLASPDTQGDEELKNVLLSLSGALDHTIKHLPKISELPSNNEHQWVETADSDWPQPEMRIRDTLTASPRDSYQFGSWDEAKKAQREEKGKEKEANNYRLNDGNDNDDPDLQLAIELSLLSYSNKHKEYDGEGKASPDNDLDMSLLTDRLDALSLSNEQKEYSGEGKASPYDGEEKEQEREELPFTMMAEPIAPDEGEKEENISSNIAPQPEKSDDTADMVEQQMLEMRAYYERCVQLSSAPYATTFKPAKFITEEEQEAKAIEASLKDLEENEKNKVEHKYTP